MDWLTQWLEGVCGCWFGEGMRWVTALDWLDSMGYRFIDATGDDRVKALQAVATSGRPELELVAHTFGPMPIESLERFDLMLPLRDESDHKEKTKPLPASKVPEVAERNELPFVVARARVVEGALKETGDDPARAPSHRYSGSSRRTLSGRLAIRRERTGPSRSCRRPRTGGSVVCIRQPLPLNDPLCLADSGSVAGPAGSAR